MSGIPLATLQWLSICVGISRLACHQFNSWDRVVPGNTRTCCNGTILCALLIPVWCILCRLSSACHLLLYKFIQR